MWTDQTVMYQIYPFGFLDAPKQQDNITVNRVKKLIPYADYLHKKGFTSVLFNPLFHSDTHGYDTTDYKTLDPRLGTNADLKLVLKTFKTKGINVMFDGVFNHVGRNFWAFKDVLKNKQLSQYKDWFSINFYQNNAYNDGFSYEGWEGHFELVKLNLKNPDVKHYLFDVVKFWVQEFDIDGLRLDVAYLLDKDFLRELRTLCESLKHDFALVGEVLFGDYRLICNDGMCTSVTNYEVYKGLFSSMNDKNMFEIAHSLNRQFGYENWCIYNQLKLLNFLDNHDVDRIISKVNDKRVINNLFALLFTVPGYPCVYYGSEWGIEGQKTKSSDDELRPAVLAPVQNDLSYFIEKLIDVRKKYEHIFSGGYRNFIITNRQLVFVRENQNGKIIVAINIDDADFVADLSPVCAYSLKDLLSGEQYYNLTKVTISPFVPKILICE